ncbi:MAG: carotenoid biosynthesis protein [Chloroflexi bacterium]|nr:carotenoid biosynthesis protein [Chloroflexota bacterium]
MRKNTAPMWARGLTKYALFAYIGTLVYMIVRPFVGLPFVLAILIFSTLSFFLFALGHAYITWGARSTLRFLVISVVVSLVFEGVGVMTGWVYGPYHYGNTLGPKVFGLVPVLIPIAWFMMLYTAHTVVEWLGRGLSMPQTRSVQVWLSLLAAFATTAWDLVMDPMMVQHSHWVWEKRGAYFGIPVHNFFGWLLTTFTIYLLFRWAEGWRSPPHRDRPTRFDAWPAVAYAATWLGDSILAWEVGLTGPAVVGFLAMGGFALLGVGYLGKTIDD